MAAAAVVLSPSAHADIIIFEHESVTPVTGRIGDTDFTAPFIITAVGDTDDRERTNHAWSIEHVSALIDIQGVGAFEFVTQTSSFVNDGNDTVGFSRSIGLGDLFNGPSNPIFHDWEMLTSIGPVAGRDGRLIQWDIDPLIETTGGILRLDDRENIEVVFTATVIPVPAVGAAIAFVCVVRRRRR